MKRFMLFCALTAILLLTFFSVDGISEVRKGAISLNPNIGGYVFQKGQHIDDNVSYGLGLGYHFTENWGVEGNFNFVKTHSNADSSNDEDVKAYLYRLDAVYHFMPEKRFVPYIAAGIGAVRISGDIADTDNGTDPLFNYGAGIKYFLTKNFALRGDIRHIITDDPKYNLIYTIGLTVMFGGEEKAVSPPAPQPVEQPQKTIVAPQPKDSDGDGVYDDVDKCPETPKGAAVDKVGCPLDSDGDGVSDYMDKCPDTPKGAAVDKVGCPLDSDGDGVPDYMDKCPDTPKGIKVDAGGCPVPLKEKVSIDLHVEFDFDSAKIKSIYKEHIEKVANFLKAYPDAEAVIEGHTDSIGDAKYNQKLSEKRAQSVKDYMVKNFGIDPARLKTKGYGESRPVADNKTKEGRQKNRRVVAVISTVITKIPK